VRCQNTGSDKCQLGCSWDAPKPLHMEPRTHVGLCPVLDLLHTKETVAQESKAAGELHTGWWPSERDGPGPSGCYLNTAKPCNLLRLEQRQ
jgi:hypothetical protein